jgi:hypothetical protein
MTDGVHAVVRAQQASRGQPPLDPPATDSERFELRARHHAVLSPGERPDRAVDLID